MWNLYRRKSQNSVGIFWIGLFCLSKAAISYAYAFQKYVPVMSSQLVTVNKGLAISCISHIGASWQICWSGPPYSQQNMFHDGKTADVSIFQTFVNQIQFYVQRRGCMPLLQDKNMARACPRIMTDWHAVGMHSNQFMLYQLHEQCSSVWKAQAGIPFRTRKMGEVAR